MIIGNNCDLDHHPVTNGVMQTPSHCSNILHPNFVFNKEYLYYNLKPNQFHRLLMHPYMLDLNTFKK